MSAHSWCTNAALRKASLFPSLTRGKKASPFSCGSENGILDVAMPNNSPTQDSTLSSSSSQHRKTVKANLQAVVRGRVSPDEQPRQATSPGSGQGGERWGQL